METYYGKYRATVSDSDDPTQSGRLRVDVSSAGVSNAWAEASLPPVPQSLLQLPVAGSIVWVEFEEGDVERPIWTGVTWGTEPAPDE